MDPDIVKFFGVMLSLALVGVGTYGAIAIVGAVVSRIKGESSRDVSPDELAYLGDRVDQVEGLSERVAELETRLDFAERLLTRQTNERHDTPAGSL